MHLFTWAGLLNLQNVEKINLYQNHEHKGRSRSYLSFKWKLLAVTAKTVKNLKKNCKIFNYEK